jgi:hypothetical protein
MDTYKNELFLAFLGSFGKFQKATVSFFMSALLCAWSNSASTGHFIMKFDI